jgi:hypothetical protein
MPFTESLVRSEAPPRHSPHNESRATAESLRGTGITVKRFNRGAVCHLQRLQCGIDHLTTAFASKTNPRPWLRHAGQYCNNRTVRPSDRC